MLGVLALAAGLLVFTGGYNHVRLPRYVEPPQYWYMAPDSVLTTPREQRKLEIIEYKLQKAQARQARQEQRQFRRLNRLR